MLICVPPKGPTQTQQLLDQIPEALEKHVQKYTFVQDVAEYEKMAEADRKAVDCIVVQLGTTCAGPVIKAQLAENANLKWVHSLSSGIDGYVAVEEFRDSDIPLTNAKGAFSTILGEFVALGVLFHTKHLHRFMQRKAEKKWEIEPVELVSTKSMAVVGYGDIGAATARIAKQGFGMKVWGVKRNPADCSEEHRKHCDEVVSNDEYERVIKEADFVVGVLPKTATTVDFFNMESTFSKMKPTAVFCNIGRGPTCKEDDLIKALQEGKIAGAVLDVFAKEPLAEDSPLWTMDNVLLTPHCMQQDKDFMLQCIQQFAENLENFTSGKPLSNIADKKRGY